MTSDPPLSSIAQVLEIPGQKDLPKVGPPWIEPGPPLFLCQSSPKSTQRMASVTDITIISQTRTLRDNINLRVDFQASTGVIKEMHLGKVGTG